MTQEVISAPPRTGKSLYLVEVMETITRLERNRFIYTNIIGIKLPGVISINSTVNKPFDWRDLPNGAVLVYDEAHEHPAFSKEDLLKTYTIDSEPYDKEIARILDYKKLSMDHKKQLLTRLNHVFTELPLELKVKEEERLIAKVKENQKMALIRAKEDILDIGRSLTMHGHFGIDIYLITQKPDLLNGFVRAATSSHLILRRYFKLPFAVIFKYAEVQDQFGNATRKNALSWRFWLYPKKLYKYYVSAEEHPVKAEIPMWIYASLLLVCCLLGYAFYNSKTSEAELFASPTSAHSTETNTAPADVAKAQAQAQQKQALPDLSNICRKAVNVDTPECKKWFDDLSKNGGSIGSITTFKYDGSKPFDTDYTPTDLEPKDFPRFKNAVVYNGKCTAFSQQGTIMHKVSKKDCLRLASGDRPFDYFAEQNNANTQPTEQNSDSNYRNELINAMVRLESEKLARSQNPEIRTEQVKLGEPKTEFLDSANHH
jgi:hypothetical protein